MFIIPIKKTACGETVSGCFSIQNDFVDLITLKPEGSRLLEEVCRLFVLIVEKRRMLYVKRAREIFWKINQIPLSGSRKAMVDEVILFLSQFILQSSSQYF